VVSAGFAAAALLGTPDPALAQRENGPFAGMFTSQATRETTQWLDFHGAFGASYDQNLVDDPTGTIGALRDSRLWESGSSVGASATLAFLRRTEKTEASMNASGSARKYSVSSDIGAAADLNGALSRKLAGKLFADVKVNGHYSPFLSFAPFSGGEFIDPAISPTTDFGFAAVSDPNAYGDVDIALVSRFTRRSEFVIGGSARQWWFIDDPARNISGYGGRVSLRHNITRPLAVHLGYGRENVDYRFEDGTTIPNDTIDAGFDYGDDLTIARRTSLTFTTSTSAIRFREETHYRLNGSLGLSRGFNRTWTIATHYDRSSEFLPTYGEPVLSDSLTANVGGMFRPRVRWSAAAGYTRATVGFDSFDDPSELIGWFSSSTTLGVSITRYWAISGQYRYYRYSAPIEGALLDFEPHLSRQVVTVALNVWLPISNVTRSTSDPR
jgi:hypothetical protein